jgi:hypothetical protein
VASHDVESFLKLSTDLELFGVNSKIIQSEKFSQNAKKCKYWNCGFCKKGRNCLWTHPEGDCKQYLEAGRCRDKDCSYRHRRVCRYWLEDGCTRKKSCQYLDRDVGDEYSSSLLFRSSEMEPSTPRECHTNDKKTEENKNEITREVTKSDSESTFDYGLLEISDIIAEGVEDKTCDKSKKKLHCTHCNYKCKHKKSLKKHIDIKHGKI